MNEETLQIAINEANRFLKKAKDCKMRWHQDKMSKITGCLESAAAKRSSMDLTRALADLRRGG